MEENTIAKHLRVRHAIVAAIQSGEFQSGQRLPSKRELANRLGVSYMTARRAVSELVESNLLERRPRGGTYTLLHSRKQLSTTTVNLICPAYGSSVVENFLRLGAKTADATALISLSDEMTIAALAACRDSNRPVPEKISIVNSGDSSLMTFSNPPVTSIDTHLERHIEAGMEMLESALSHTIPRPDLLRLIEPHLVERRSVAPPSKVL